MEPITLLGLTLFGGATAEYLFSSVITCAVVNLLTDKISDKNKDMLAEQMVGRNHDIQQAMEEAFQSATKIIVKKWWEKRRKRLSIIKRIPESAETVAAEKCGRTLLKNTGDILFGGKDDTLDDAAVRNLMLPGYLNAGNIRKAREQARHKFARLIEPHISDAPKSLREVLRNHLLDKTVLCFRDLFKENKRVSRIITFDKLADLQAETGELKELNQIILQSVLQFSQLWAASDEKLDAAFAQVSRWHQSINPKLDTILSKLDKLEGTVKSGFGKLEKILLENNLGQDKITEFFEILSKIENRLSGRTDFPHQQLNQTDAFRNAAMNDFYSIPAQSNNLRLILRDILRIAEIADRENAEQLKLWSGSVSQSLDSGEEKQAEPQADSSEKFSPHLLVFVKPHDEDNQYLLDFFLWRNEDIIEQWNQKDSICLMDEISGLLDDILAKDEEGRKRTVVPKTLEFFLPYEIISHDFDQKFMQKYIRVKKKYGKKYHLIVRALDRLELENDQNPLSLDNWRDRWNQFKNANDGNSIFWLCDRNKYNAEELCDELNTCSEHNCLMMTFRPSFHSDENDLMLSILDEGIPVALWFREHPDCCLNAQDVKQEMKKIISGGTLADLPGLVKTKRMESREKGDIGNHLTLLWDDPNRLPPEYGVDIFDIFEP